MKDAGTSQLNNPIRVKPHAFTLVEMITVIAIIGILMAAVVPGASSMWAERNQAASTNLVKGLLQSAQTQAIRSGERGLLFFIDRDGVQRVVFIEADPPDMSDGSIDSNDCGTGAVITEKTAVNRFRVMEGKIYSLPTPYRVTPLWSLESDNADSFTRPKSWPDQLGERQFDNPSIVTSDDTPRYHRNFFTIIFDTQGQLVVGRDVLIHDHDSNDDGRGDGTALLVNDVSKWLMIEKAQKVTNESVGGSKDKLYDMVVLGSYDDPGSEAANFISVAGLVAYDDSEVSGWSEGGQVRAHLRTEGLPFYISRYTGDVIQGSIERSQADDR